MELFTIVALYLIAGAVIMMIIQPHLDSKYHTMFYSIAGIIISPVCIMYGFIEGIIKTFRKGGKDNDQT